MLARGDWGLHPLGDAAAGRVAMVPAMPLTMPRSAACCAALLPYAARSRACSAPQPNPGCGDTSIWVPPCLRLPEWSFLLKKPLPAYPCLSCGPLSRATLPGDGVTFGWGLGGLLGWGHGAKHTTEHQLGLLSRPGAATGPSCKKRSPSARRSALDVSPAVSDCQRQAGLGWTTVLMPRSSCCFWPYRGRSGGTVWPLGCGEQREPHPQEPSAMPEAARSGTAPQAGGGVSLLYVFN